MSYQSWAWSSSQKGDGEWNLVTRKRKKWASGAVSPGGKSSPASSGASVDKSAIKAHCTFLEVVLGDSGSQPTKHSEPERQKIAAETTSRIEKIERLIALVGDDESLAGHKASLERDLAAAQKNRFPRAHGPLQLRLRKSQSTFLSRRLVSNSSLRTLRRPNLSGGAYSFTSAAELRAFLVPVPANMDVNALEIQYLERQELEQRRLLAIERCPISLASKQLASSLRDFLERWWYTVG